MAKGEQKTVQGVWGLPRGVGVCTTPSGEQHTTSVWEGVINKTDSSLEHSTITTWTGLVVC